MEMDKTVKKIDGFELGHASQCKREESPPTLCGNFWTFLDFFQPNFFEIFGNFDKEELSYGEFAVWWK